MILVQNRHARHEYDIEQKYTAGVVLSGQETKSLRLGRASLVGSYVRIVGGEAILLNAQITPYQFANNPDYEPKRTRKLLLKKSEIQDLETWSTQKKRSLVALNFKLVSNRIKLTIGIGRGLKSHDKRRKLKERDQKRELQKQFKRSVY
ncbi:MAG: SsrA-binding protein SmpB [Patescibacteria group bacterium]